MPKTIVKIGPSDHGQSMSLDEFDEAEVQPGYIYELGRGIIIVSDIPGGKHFAIVNEIRKQLSRYDLTHQKTILTIASGGENKNPFIRFESERHPNLALYHTLHSGAGKI